MNMNNSLDYRAIYFVYDAIDKSQEGLKHKFSPNVMPPSFPAIHSSQTRVGGWLIIINWSCRMLRHNSVRTEIQIRKSPRGSERRYSVTLLFCWYIFFFPEASWAYAWSWSGVIGTRDFLYTPMMLLKNERPSKPDPLSRRGFNFLLFYCLVGLASLFMTQLWGQTWAKWPACYTERARIQRQYNWLRLRRVVSCFDELEQFVTTTSRRYFEAKGRRVLRCMQWALQSIVAEMAGAGLFWMWKEFLVV